MQKTDTEFVTAGFFPRLGAYLLDRLIVGAGLFLVIRLPMLIASFSTDFFTQDVFFRFNLRQIICWCIVSAYFVLCTARCGATIGKRAFRMRVVRLDGTPISPLTALYRETIGRYLSSLLCIGYLLMLGDTSHQTLHDHLCDTLVVYSETRPEKRRRAPRKALPAPTEPVTGWYAPNR